MLTKAQITEIREHLESAQNPLFYFDNDQDGLSSYLLLRRFIGRGNGVPVKVAILDMEYFRRIKEFNPDYVFVLDQPKVSEEFFKKLNELNIPIVWIDHHENDIKEIPKFVNYYNPFYNEPSSNEPVTILCYKITNRKEDLWISILGCIADKYLPEEYNLFLKKYPDLGIESKDAFEILYGSEIGKISRMIGAGLKDRTSLVMKMIHFLVGVKTPYEILEENVWNQNLHKRFHFIDNKLQKYFKKAKEEYSGGKVLFFKYSGETSMSADIANKLSYEFPNIVLVVAFIKGARVNLSIRGKLVREKVINILKEFPLSSGGGHENAVGAQIDLEQIDKFEKQIREIFK